MIDDFINVPLHDSNNLPPPYIVRVILVFGRSRASVSFEKGKKASVINNSRLQKCANFLLFIKFCALLDKDKV